MGRDVMAGAARASGTVLVIDEEGGWPTVSLVDYLAEDPAVGFDLGDAKRRMSRLIA